MSKDPVKVLQQRLRLRGKKLLEAELQIKQYKDSNKRLGEAIGQQNEMLQGLAVCVNDYVGELLTRLELDGDMTEAERAASLRTALLDQPVLTRLLGYVGALPAEDALEEDPGDYEGADTAAETAWMIGAEHDEPVEAHAT